MSFQQITEEFMTIIKIVERLDFKLLLIIKNLIKSFAV